jgi:molecular chaperone GrpE
METTQNSTVNASSLHENSGSEEALQACEQEVIRWKEQCLRISADMENMKRRAVREQEQTVNRTLMHVFSELLPIIDNFDRALASVQSADQHSPLYFGLILIRKELAGVLEGQEVRPMPESTEFDPEMQEAIAQVPDTNRPSGSIVAVLEKGYFYKNQVLRHAKVTVAV